jgi:hypothetical protein
VRNDSGRGAYSNTAYFTTGDQIVAVEKTEKAIEFMLDRITQTVIRKQVSGFRCQVSVR